jgi:membrane-bound serine protease (ClpP class)
VVLIVLALGLFIVDIFAPTHGALTAGGVISFFIGSLMLVEAEPGFRIPWTLALPGTLVTAAFFGFVIGAGLRAQYLPARTGAGTMVGRVATALTRINADQGQIFVEGEYWAARSDVPIESGELAEVVRIRGLTLDVRPAVPAPGASQET